MWAGAPRAVIQLAVNREMMLKPYVRQGMLHPNTFNEAGHECSWLLE